MVIVWGDLWVIGEWFGGIVIVGGDASIVGDFGLLEFGSIHACE